jgi:hypothetical protein
MWEKRGFSPLHSIQTGPAGHTAFCSVGIHDPASWVKRPESEVNFPLSSSSEAKDTLHYSFTLKYMSTLRATTHFAHCRFVVLPSSTYLLAVGV